MYDIINMKQDSERVLSDYWWRKIRKHLNLWSIMVLVPLLATSGFSI